MQATVELLADEIQNYAKERNLNILIKTAWNKEATRWQGGFFMI
jgi:hypothetical protein